MHLAQLLAAAFDGDVDDIGDFELVNPAEFDFERNETATMPRATSMAASGATGSGRGGSTLTWAWGLHPGTIPQPESSRKPPSGSGRYITSA